MRFPVMILLFLLALGFGELRAQSVVQSIPDRNIGIPNFTNEEMITTNLHIERFTDPRITFGEPADIKDSPWQVALIWGMYPDPGRGQFCGGSIISNKWVVTAAHCVIDSAVHGVASKVDIVANTTFYNQGGDRLKVKSIYYHPRYDRSNYDYDVALLRLEDVGPAVNIKSIQLPEKQLAIAPGTTVSVTGWGATAEGSAGSLYLIGAVIPIVDNKTCNSRVAYANKITAEMFCAGIREGGADACQGDSGGPAVLRNAASDPILLGIISNGLGCARRDKYGVYTDVRSVRDWLDTQMADVP